MNLCFSYFLFCLCSSILLAANIFGEEDNEVKEMSGLKVVTITPKIYSLVRDSTATYVERGYVSPRRETVVTDEIENR